MKINIKSKISWSKYLVLIFLVTLSSCKKDNKQTIEQIVTEWSGKSIKFPDDAKCKVMGRDTLAPDLFKKPYKILLYVDSMGCMSCKLRMPEWKKIIHEADSIAPGQVGFLFYFNPKNPKDIDYITKRDRFQYPVFIDEDNSIDKMNHFPKAMPFQSFLLDKDNKVLLVGNPSMNPHIWELFKQQITGTLPKVKAPETTVKVSNLIVEVPDMKMGKTSNVLFVIKNTGENPLIINDVKSSCGCTIPTWEKSPIEAGKETTLWVEIKPEETGYFRKTIDVYCNVKEYAIPLTVAGTVE